MTLLRSIKRQLVALVIAPFAVIVLVFAGTTWSTWNQRLEAERKANLEMARAVASAFDAYLQGLREQTAVLGRAIERIDRPDDVTALLVAAVQGRAALRAAAWAGPDGVVRRASDPALVGSSMAPRPELRAVASGAEWALGNLVASRTGDEVTFGFAHAAHDRDGRLSGIVVVTVDADRLDERALRLQRVGNAGFALVDAAGRLVMRTPRVERTWAERDTSRVELVRRALGGEEAVGDTVSMATGEAFIGAAVPIRPLGWVARAGRSRAEVLAPIWRDLGRAVGWGAAVAALALAASAAAGSRIARSLRRLERHAEVLGRGELPRRAIEGPDEIARLGRAFDEMSARLLAAREARDRLTADLERQRVSYEKTFRAAPVGMAVIAGSTLRVRWANPAYLACLEPRHRAAGIDGLTLEEVLPGAGERGLVDLFARVAREGVPYEAPAYRYDGFARGTAWFSWSVRPVAAPEGEGTDLLLLATEITEQIRREVVLEAGAVIGQSLDRGEVADRIARIAVPRLADWCVVDALAEDGSVVRLAFAADRPGGGGDDDGPAIRSPGGPRPVQVEHAADAGLASIARDAAHAERLARAGVRAWITAPLRVRGEVIGALTLVSAHSGRRFGAEDVRLAEALAHQAAQALDSARLFEATRRAVRHRDEVLAVVSHDLRTPLTAVVMGASALASSAGRGEVHPERVVAAAARIQGAGERMNRMVNDLLDLASIDEGRLALAPEACSPAALIREAADQARPMAEGKGLQLDWQAAPGLPQVRCDGGRVLQVLGNLLSNAVKAAESGFVLVRAMAAGGEVRFEVTDSGPGIAREDLPHVFDRYRRGRGAAYRGTGLGLAVARGVVEAHGGRIWIESRPGEGTRVSFTLPIGGPEPARAAEGRDAVGKADPGAATGG